MSDDDQAGQGIASTERGIGVILNILAGVVVCESCETRLRFGDLECPHCGKDLEDVLRRWAEALIAGLYADRG